MRKMMSIIAGSSGQAGHAAATSSSVLSLQGAESCRALLAEAAFKGKTKAVLYKEVGLS